MVVLAALVFYVLCGLVLAAAVYMLLSHNLVRVLVALLFVVVGLGFIYFFLGADAAGAAQLLVYAGGVVVLMLFGIMLTPVKEEQAVAGRYSLIGGVALGGGIMALLSRLVLHNTPTGGMADLNSYAGGSLEGAGRILILQYGLPLEISAILLLVALVFAGMAAWHSYRTQ
jgi:NADH:ubiquinone oxidoreductase subunit 6 (subunit J)